MVRPSSAQEKARRVTRSTSIVMATATQFVQDPSSPRCPAQNVASIRCANNNTNHPNVCISFDSGNPTGGDRDLGTPNQAFGGPGVGSGGEPGMPGENNTALHNVLIIAEDVGDANQDGLVSTTPMTKEVAASFS